MCEDERLVLRIQNPYHGNVGGVWPPSAPPDSNVLDTIMDVSLSTVEREWRFTRALLRSKLDRVYEDRLSYAISDELWTAKSSELQEELRRVRTEMERHEGASEAYEAAGLQILELAQSAYSLYVTQNSHSRPDW